MKLNFSVRNIFQMSTLKAVMVILNVVGLSVPEPVVQGLSTVGLAVWGLWESFRDEKAEGETGITYGGGGGTS